MNPFDVAVYHFVNHFAGHHGLVDAVMKFVAKDALEIYAVLFIAAWFALPRVEEDKRHALVVSFCSGVMALLINLVIAHIWFRPRPFTVLPKGTFTQLIPHAPDASFPSDHASGAYAFASGVWGRGARWVSVVFTLVAVLTMIARVYVGVHWPTDVLASLVVGVLAGRIMWRLERYVAILTRIGLRIFRYGRYAGQHVKGAAGQP
ncbi:MAG: undecaprenyl-diphosphatase [Alicyclobacillus macrosporangiidus]|uniref:undecaprenyl-diphosphatase n=1 Tax=Alicyclobacillus macrosporangiidus TaxID=392015 RepID=UPI0026F270CE|nr:undecaprenyl-diphosphatase [Alicyclobacillus macrosporangiidus]MCL6601088.1 undecaprenyl-diphosphatase [Alicyclobacillus macrosporangiidus]